MPTISGPSGGTGGNYFADNPTSQIAKLRVRHGAYVDSLEVTWTDGSTAQHGGQDGDSAPDVDEFVMNTGEYLTSVVGTIGALLDDGGPYILSIQFNTSTGRASPVWGDSTGINASNPPAYYYGPESGQVITGFIGRSGKYLDAIGVIFDTAPAGMSVGAYMAGITGQQGPAGGNGGNPFYDVPPGSISQIQIKSGWYVDVIQVTWSDGTTSTHGGGDGDSPPNIDSFVLNSGESLLAIDGGITQGDSDGTFVKSIRFTTNQRVSQYYGGSGLFSTPYQFHAPSGSAIVAFWGRSGKYVDAIGVLTG